MPYQYEIKEMKIKNTIFLTKSFQNMVSQESLANGKPLQKWMYFSATTYYTLHFSYRA